jgi:tetratricopeptide (TPR) repeat protein/tRNA A-37 threonylcarbamoyl transferase component Bud32
MSPPTPERPLDSTDSPLSATPSASDEGGTMPEITPSRAALASGPILVEIPGYEVLGELGRGGMAVVLKGRDPELSRDLAIKVLLERHRDNADVVRRFVEEAQIGGQLQHPGIVPVYEAGRLPDSRPYFTMKLVAGRTLAALLKDRHAPTHDLPRFLKIFEQMCQTLAYAHAQGVIHRDLKPLNVMVGAFGEVQVMDWGLAKVVKSGGVRTTRSERPEEDSQAGSILGTPAYMAPEQACGDVEGLDERCDVFGLGAILCEVLTGSPPYRGRETGELLRKAARADLSDAIARLDACGAEAELVQLAKVCLSAESADRPRDAGAAAAAMTAYLAGVQERLRKAELERAAAQARAEEAQAKTRAERRARRMTVALAATLLLAVTGAGAGALWYQHDQSLRAAEHNRRASATERDVTAALEEATALGKQAATLKDDPEKWGAALTVALSAVKRAEGVLNNGEGGEDLRARVGALRAELEVAEKDERMIAALEAARFQEANAGHEGGYDVEGAVAMYKAAFQQDDQGWDSLEPDEAAARINQRAIRDDMLAALADWSNITANKQDSEKPRVILQAADPDPASVRNRWNAAMEKKDLDGLRRLATSSEVRDQPTVRLVAFARTLTELGAAPEAVKFLKDANEQRPGDFWIAFELANACYATKPSATDEAIRYFTAALMLRPNSVVAHYDLGVATADKHQLDEAIAEYHKAIQIQPDYAEAHSSLGNALRDKGRLDEAIAECRKALQIQPDFAEAHNNLGNALYSKHQLDEAITEYRKAFQVQPNFALAHSNLSSVLLDKGRLDEAIAECRKALQIQPDFALAHSSLGNALRDKGRLDEAVTEYRKALQIQPELAQTHVNLGAILGGKHQWDEAIVESRKAIQIQPEFAQAHINLGAALGGKHQWDEAIAEFRKAVALKPDRVEAHYNLGIALSQMHQWDDASTEFGKAFKIQPDLVGAAYNAACAAALASCGQGEDPAKTDEKERSRWRKQAQDWLRAALNLWTKKIDDGKPEDRAAAAKEFKHCQEDSDLASVRDKGTLAKLPADEQDAWRKLWADVDALLKKAHEK